jgi:hypothetical protein
MLISLIEEIKFDIKEWFHFHAMKIEKPLEAQFLKCLSLMGEGESKTKRLKKWQTKKRRQKLKNYLQNNKHLAMTYCNFGGNESLSLLDYVMSKLDSTEALVILDVIAEATDEKKEEFWSKKTSYSYLFSAMYCSQNIVFEKMVNIGARFTEQELKVIQIKADTHQLLNRMEFYQHHLIKCEKKHLESLIGKNDNGAKLKPRIKV